jgi:hypothetical protein
VLDSQSCWRSYDEPVIRLLLFNALKCSKDSQTIGFSSSLRLMSTARWRDVASCKPHPTGYLS